MAHDAGHHRDAGRVPEGLLPQPPLGSGTWWLARLEWEVVLAIVTLALLSLLSWQRRAFTSPVPTLAAPVPNGVAEALLYLGTAACALALALFSANGFAPGGHFPFAAVVLFAAAALLVAVGPRERVRQYTSRT